MSEKPFVFEALNAVMKHLRNSLQCWNSKVNELAGIQAMWFVISLHNTAPGYLLISNFIKQLNKTLKT